MVQDIFAEYSGVRLQNSSENCDNIFNRYDRGASCGSETISGGELLTSVEFSTASRYSVLFRDTI